MKTNKEVEKLIAEGNSKNNAPFLIGNGFDTHVLASGRKLILGGIEIPHEKGLLAHSDGDVLLHALTDAILGAMGWGDIGCWFPDTSQSYKNANSAKLLARVMQNVQQTHHMVNADITVIAEKPKLFPYFSKMRKEIAKITKCKAVNLKATTTEKMNDEGKGLCISAMAVCLLGKN